MSTSPILLSPYHVVPNRNLRGAWLPVLGALVFICFTSTSFMGGKTTQFLVDAVWKVVFGTSHWELTGVVNEYCRKVGHFFGYGMIGLIFRNAWYTSARAFTWVIKSWLIPFAATMAVASTFIVACLDEWHQTFCPGRVGCLRDALIDAAGAVFLNVTILVVRARRRKKLLAAC